jgi:hypothetical protein
LSKLVLAVPFNGEPGRNQDESFTGFSLLAVGALAVAACSGSEAAGVEDAGDASDACSTTTEVVVIETDPPATDPPATSPAPTNPPVATTPEPDPTAPELPITDPDPIADPVEMISLLASDKFNGRDNQTEGSAAPRDLMVSLLSEVAAPAVPDGDGGLGFLQEYDLGTNIIGIVPGRGELANEYVMIGAHYDHLAPGECDVRDEVDDAILQRRRRQRGRRGVCDDQSRPTLVADTPLSAFADDEQTGCSCEVGRIGPLAAARWRSGGHGTPWR